jgi:hypothetical protein
LIKQQRLNSCFVVTLSFLIGRAFRAQIGNGGNVADEICDEAAQFRNMLGAFLNETSRMMRGLAH